MESMALDAVDVRKRWIRSWKAMLGYYLVIGFLSLVCGVFDGWADDGGDAIAGVFLSLWALLWLFLCRKYAYKKTGTKLLTFVLVVSGLGMLRRFSELTKSGIDLYGFADYAIFIAIFIWFIITSLTLLDFNKKINKQKKIGNLKIMKNRK